MAKTFVRGTAIGNSSFFRLPYDVLLNFPRDVVEFFS